MVPVDGSSHQLTKSTLCLPWIVSSFSCPLTMSSTLMTVPGGLWCASRKSFLPPAGWRRSGASISSHDLSGRLAVGGLVGGGDGGEARTGRDVVDAAVLLVDLHTLRRCC